MATITLRTLMQLEFTEFPSIEQITNGLQFAKTSKYVQQNKPLMDFIDSALKALTAYQIAMDALVVLKAAKALLNQATKIGQAVLNPGIIPELASDAAEYIANLAAEKAKEIPEQVTNMIMDYPIEI